MKRLSIAAILVSLSFTAVADVSPTSETVDFGIEAGALSSKTFQVKIGKYSYTVIAVDLGEPACNSVQTLVRVDDPNLDQDGSVLYNLGIQTAGVTSAKANGNNVVIAVRKNSPEDCSQSTTEAYAIQYTGSPDRLSVKKAK
ncbi:MAG: hypothetical protein LBE24_05495 [Methylobacillus sp.]|jgi:hypothetical protein|nr:hypothetical protein [Methylobacillus sp.]